MHDNLDKTKTNSFEGIRIWIARVRVNQATTKACETYVMRSVVTVITVPELVSVHSGLRSRKALEKGQIQELYSGRGGGSNPPLSPRTDPMPLQSSNNFFLKV